MSFFKRKKGIVTGSVATIGVFSLLAVVYPPIVPATLAWWWIIPCGINPASLSAGGVLTIGAASVVAGSAAGVAADKVEKACYM